MKNYKTFFTMAILFAVLTAIAAAYGYNSIAGVVNVVVSKRDISMDKAIQPEFIGIIKIPKGAVQMDTVRNPIELKDMVAKGYIPAGTVLRKSMFQPGATAGVRTKLKPGYVAIAVEKNLDTSCSDQIAVNSRVNIKSFTKQGSVEKPATDIQVIAVTDKGMVIAVPEEISDAIIAQKNIGKLTFELLPARDGE